jgi:hypothetical protein
MAAHRPRTTWSAQVRNRGSLFCVKWWIVLAVLGGVLVLSSTGIGRDDGGTGEITCGSEVMRPGDVCEETRRGVVTDTYTYEDAVRERAASAEHFAAKGRWIQLGLGSGLIVLAVTGIIVTKRRRARRPPTTADLYLRQREAWQHQQAAQSAQAAHVQQPPHQPPHGYPVQQPYPRQYPPQQYPPQQYPPQQHPPQQYPDFGPRGGG